MALVAIVHGQAQAHGSRALGTMLGVTSDAVAPVEDLDPRGIPRIRELRGRMGVLRFSKFATVTRDAGSLQIIRRGKPRLVTSLALEFDLIVSIRRFSRQKQLFRSG